MKLRCLTRYDDLGASSRVRFTQYFGLLRRELPELCIERQALLDDDYLQRKYAQRPVVAGTLRGYARRLASLLSSPLPDVWWVEKELWPYVPGIVERLVLSRRPYVLDLDDAIFHNYDLHSVVAVRHLLGRKIDRLMAGAALVAAGNPYLAERARHAGARRIEVLPTVVDLRRYAPHEARAQVDEVLKIGWVGSPATAHYLAPLAAPLARLAKTRRLRLVVIGGSGVSMPGVEVETIPWHSDTEAASIARLDIGVMPLTDSPWEQGKCGYKLIQYMACAVPVIASPVGVNASIVEDGVNGILATTDEAWYRAFDTLAADEALRRRLGSAGRHKVQSQYSLQVTAPRLARWLREIDREGGR